MSDLDSTNWAAAHYRVERESSGVMTSKRKLKRIAEQAVRHGDPAPEPSRDVVRIYDREGRVVFERDWGENRTAALAQEATIVDDLLRLDVPAFRVRYGIPFDDVAGPDAEPGPSVPQADPWAGWPEGPSGDA